MHPKHLIFILLFLTSTTFYYNLTDPSSNLTTAQVTKITDGDTIKINNAGLTRVMPAEGQTLRPLGINTPEKNQPYYQEAKDFLAQKIQNKTIQIESKGPDKYYRTLAYIFLNKQNINAQILAHGLGTLYYYDHDNHYEELKQAEEFARLNNLGIWKKSPNSNCIKITNFQYTEPESLTLQNLCNIKLNITYKDDATHIYQATINPNPQYTKTFSHIWNTNGDSIYIYDTKGLILFYRY